jgi:hypothetical protein
VRKSSNKSSIKANKPKERANITGIIWARPICYRLNFARLHGDPVFVNDVAEERDLGALQLTLGLLAVELVSRRRVNTSRNSCSCSSADLEYIRISFRKMTTPLSSISQKILCIKFMNAAGALVRPKGSTSHSKCP